MLRGENRLVDLEPVRGGEAGKRRPAVIVSNDRANSVAVRLGRGVVTVVPVTANTGRIFPFQTLLPGAMTGLRQDSKAQAEQVRSITVESLGSVLGRVPSGVMAQLAEALRLHLQLSPPTRPHPREIRTAVGPTQATSVLLFWSMTVGGRTTWTVVTSC